MIPLTGYINKLSAQPGGSLEFKISSQSEYSARLIRIICGDPNPDGPGIKYEPVEGASLEGTHKGRVQPVHLGSYAITQPFQIIEAHNSAADDDGADDGISGVFSISATISRPYLNA